MTTASRRMASTRALPASRCAYDLDAGIIRGIDWQGISLLVLQSQILLGDRCNNPAAIQRYVDFVAAIAGPVRAKSATVRIVAQFSFRHTPPERMIAAMRALRGVVAGYYIAYPSNVGPRCRYCSPANLDAVLAAVSLTLIPRRAGAVPEMAPAKRSATLPSASRTSTLPDREIAERATQGP